MTIEIWLTIALLSSLSLTGVLVWLSIIQSRRLSYISENAGDLIDIIANYKKHLKKIYEMEMFYGDETLEYLMEHTRSLVDILEEEYGDIVFITEPLEIDYNKEEENASEEQEETSREEDVFYAGSRKRNT
jgi:hypothetical protein|tara:strand:+ start:244 stop:636 length:393 start_codon:yes stop_codon:yes gene_type:complete